MSTKKARPEQKLRAGRVGKSASTCAVQVVFQEPAMEVWGPHPRLSDPATVPPRTTRTGLRAPGVLNERPPMQVLVGSPKAHDPLEHRRGTNIIPASPASRNRRNANSETGSNPQNRKPETRRGEPGASATGGRQQPFYHKGTKVRTKARNTKDSRQS